MRNTCIKPARRSCNLGSSCLSGAPNMVQCCRRPSGCNIATATRGAYDWQILQASATQLSCFHRERPWPAAPWLVDVCDHSQVQPRCVRQKQRQLAAMRRNLRASPLLTRLDAVKERESLSTLSRSTRGRVMRRASRPSHRTAHLKQCVKFYAAFVPNAYVVHVR